MPERVPWMFEVIVHVMELFVVLGIASSIYFVRKNRRRR